jgi:hypothetical protein
MAVPLRRLRAAAARSQAGLVVNSVQKAQARGWTTAFLCHSHLDKAEAQGLQVVLQDDGWNVYVDWQDTAMPNKPDRETARRIQSKIRELTWFLFLATPNSLSSRWCPWELGFADVVKQSDKVVVILTEDDNGTFHGNEYMNLYRTIQTSDRESKLGIFPAGASRGDLIRTLS